MKTISNKSLPNGKRRLIIELADDEAILPIAKGVYYKLGGQLDDIVESFILVDTVPVSWCSIEQKWIE